MAKKRFKKLTSKEKDTLVGEEQLAANPDVPAEELAKAEFKKRKKAGTLSEVLDKKPDTTPTQPPVADNREQVGIAAQEDKPIVSEITDEGTVEPTGGAKILGDLTKPESTLTEDLVTTPKAKTAVREDDHIAQEGILKSLTDPEQRGLDATQQSEYIDEITEGRTVGEQISQDAANAEAKKTELEKAVEGGTGDVGDGMRYIDKSSIDAYTDDLMANAWEYESDEFRNRAQLAMKMLDRRKASAGEPAIERLSLEEYYPTAGQNIAVGSYSRKTLGSGNIYSSGGFVIPMSIIDARSRAIEGAAKEKAKKAQKVIEDMWAQGAVQYQDQIDRMGMDMLEKYGEAVGWDYAALADRTNPVGRDFYKDMIRFQTFAKQTKEVEKTADRIGEMMVGKDSETIDIPDVVEKAYYDWKNGMADMDEFFRNPKGYAKIAGLMKAYDSEQYFVKDLANSLKDRMDNVLIDPNNLGADFYESEDIKSAIVKMRGGNQDIHYLTKLKFMDEDRVRQLAKNLYREHNGFAPDVTEEMVLKDLVAQFGREIDVQTHTHRHDRANIALQKRKLDLQESEKKFFEPILAKENQNIGMFANVVRNTKEGYLNRDRGLAEVFETNDMGTPNIGSNGLFINGEVLSNHNVPKGARRDVQVGSMRYGGGRLNYNEYIAELKDKEKRGEKLNDTEEWFIQNGGNAVIAGASLTVSQSGLFVHDGKTWRVATNKDSADLIEQGQSGIRMTYGGTVKGQQIQRKHDQDVYASDGKTLLAKKGQLMTGKVYTKYDKYTQETQRVAFPSGEEPGSDWTYIGLEEPVMKDIKLVLPQMSEENLSSSGDNIRVADIPYWKAREERKVENNNEEGGLEDWNQ